MRVLLVLAAELLHLPGEPAGVGIDARAARSSHRTPSPAGRAGRGRSEGAVATMAVSEITVKACDTVPKFTPVAPVNPLPWMTTRSPPPVLPPVVPSEDTLGAPALE